MLVVRFLMMVVLCVAMIPAFASQVSVSPVRVDILNPKTIVPITVYNAGDEVVVMETSMRIWNQSSTSGQWLLSPTKDVQAYPGLIRIQPKSSAVVRVGLMPGMTVGQLQKSYRLFLRELTDPRPNSGANVRMVLNINLPVFVGGEGTVMPQAKDVLTATLRPGGIVNFVYQNPKDAATLSPQEAIYTWLGEKGVELAKTPGKIDAYALPGGVGRWNHPLPVDCKKVKSISVRGERGVLLVVPLNCQ